MENPRAEQPIWYRIVLKGRLRADVVANGDDLDFTDHIFSSMYAGTNADPHTWTSAEIGFIESSLPSYSDVVLSHLASHRYALEVLQDGQWTEIKALTPDPDPEPVLAPEPPCPECGHSDCDGSCTYDPYEDDTPSSQEVYNRAFAHSGDAEQAREAATMHPGDFI